MKPLMFKGKPFSAKQPSQVVGKILAWLDRQPEHEIFGTDELVTKIGVARCSVQRLPKQPEAAAYSYCHEQQVRYYGNPKAIVALKKLLTESGK